MEKNKKQDLKEITKETTITTVLEVGSDAVADFAKESVTGLVAELAIDGVASLVPGLSGVYGSLKRAKLERNMESFSEDLASRITELQTNLENKSIAQKQQIDKLYGYVMDYVIDEQQEDKIKYMVNGFVKLTEHEDVTEDFVLTYYDVLKELRIVDIAVLRLYNYSYDQEQERLTFEDVMKQHGLSYDQYDSIRNNLFRLGILTTKTEKKILDDLKNLFQSIKDIHDYLEKQAKGKKTSNLKLKKLNSKDIFEISKFGRDIVEFFFNLKETS
ncbi:TPA: hypothetical protein ROY05_002665 [Bacillus toyonensis]|uniref:hypothetical protein n=1 Tax=Bacillus toyonensis TaxID=155322 RepID=UPI000BF0F163|nr:hypothetical protein [Bacillus toyonensis]PEL50142.1 hypothetical protein CN638_19735 [Bacillus toyonensis]HDX9658032.1 hypothetical protein [Bacillus toyonensis]